MLLNNSIWFHLTAPPVLENNRGNVPIQLFGHPFSISSSETRHCTAISIYVVGSKLQGYGTRPKGGMGRLELILGFRGCRREMDMEAENTISIANISFIQMACHRRSLLYGRGIVNFADNYSLRSHIPLRSCLVGLRLWSDNVNWNSCIFII